jgi:hypothetical protein
MQRPIYTHYWKKVVIIDKKAAERLGILTIKENDNHALVLADYCDLIEREGVDYAITFSDLCSCGRYRGDCEIVRALVLDGKSDDSRSWKFVSYEFYKLDELDWEYAAVRRDKNMVPNRAAEYVDNIEVALDCADPNEAAKEIAELWRDWDEEEKGWFALSFAALYNSVKPVNGCEIFEAARKIVENEKAR